MPRDRGAWGCLPGGSAGCTSWLPPCWWSPGRRTAGREMDSSPEMLPEPDDLVPLRVPLPGGALHLLQPSEASELPDDGPVQWAPLVPYWSVLWRSGATLAREVSSRPLAGLRVVE